MWIYVLPAKRTFQGFMFASRWLIWISLETNSGWEFSNIFQFFFVDELSISWEFSEFSINSQCTKMDNLSPSAMACACIPNATSPITPRSGKKLRRLALPSVTIGYHRLWINHSLPHWGESCLLPEQLFWSPLAASTEESQASHMSWNSNNDD